MDDPRSWWEDGVLARLVSGAHEEAASIVERVRGAAALGVDGLILRPARDDEGRAALEAASESGIRLLIELSGIDDPDQLAATGRDWCTRGARGLVIELGESPRARGSKVTRLFEPSPDPGAGGASPAEILRDIVDESPDRILVARRPEGGPGPAVPGPHLVIETTLSWLPWRAAGFARAIQGLEEAYPKPHWPGHVIGAPRRGPFAIGLDGEAALACTTALHLTLRGTPCLDFGTNTGLPENRRRAQRHRRLIELRRRESALHRGGQRALAQEKSIFGYLREFQAERLAVVVNMGRRTRRARLPTGFSWTVLDGVGPSAGQRVTSGELELPGCGWLVARAGAPQSRTLGGRGQRRATGR